MAVAIMDQYTIGIRPVRKRPIQVYAAEITENNYYELAAWARDQGGRVEHYDPDHKTHREHGDAFWIQTFGQWRVAKVGEYLIRGTEGEFYAIPAEVFANVYEDIPREG